MEAIVVLLVFALLLGTWSLFRREVLMLFVSFFFVTTSILINKGGLNLSVLAIRVSIFSVIVLLHFKHRASILAYISKLLQSRFFIGYILLLTMAITSTMLSTTLVNAKISSIINMFIHTLIPMMLFIVFWDREESYSRFPIYFVILTLISLGAIYRFLDTSQLVIQDRTTIKTMGFNSIFLSRIGVLCLISAILHFYYVKRSVDRIICLLAIVISILFILISSQRASIIGFAFALLIWLQFGVKVQGSLKPILIVLMLAIILASVNLEQFAVIDRFRDLERYQEYERFGDYSTSLLLFIGKPFFGHGLLGYFETTGRVYPHNLFLEIMVEYGAVGLIIYLVMLIDVLQVIRRIFHRPNANFGLQVIALSWIALFITTMLAGTFNGNYDFFILSGLLSSLKQKSFLPSRSRATTIPVRAMLARTNDLETVHAKRN